MEKRLCCYIPNQEKLDEQCQSLAEYQIWMGYSPTPDDYTESCAEHLEEMLDDSVRFEIIRISPDGLPVGHHDSSLECTHPFCVSERTQMHNGARIEQVVDNAR